MSEGVVMASPAKPSEGLAAEPWEDAGSVVSSDMDTESVTTSMVTSVEGNAVITQKEFDEEQQLADEANKQEQAELAKRKQVWLHMEEDSKEERYKRLQCLLTKSNMYTEYLLSRMDTQKEEEKKRRERIMLEKQADKQASEQQGKEKESTNNADNTTIEDTSNKEQENIDQGNTDTALKKQTDNTLKDTNTGSDVKEDSSKTDDNSQKSIDASSSGRRTRSTRLSLRAPISKSKLSTSNSPALASSVPSTPGVTTENTASPATPGKQSSKTPNIEVARLDTKEHTESERDTKNSTKSVNNDKTDTTRAMENSAKNTSGSSTLVSSPSRNDATQATEQTGSPDSGKENASPKNDRMDSPNIEDFEDCLRGYLGDEFIPRPADVIDSEEENEDPYYTTSKRGRKRKNKDYNEQSPQGAKLLTHFFKPSTNKRRKLDAELDAVEAEQKEQIKKSKKKVEVPLEPLYPDISPEGNIVRPALLTGGNLRNYQVEGLNWLKVLFENGVNGILADEMGLGKTIQCVSLICQLISMGATGPFMVVAPLSTLPNWRNEFQRFSPRIPVVFYHGSKEDRLRMQRKIVKTHLVLPNVRVHPVVITSYEIAMRDRQLLQRFCWTYMIVDEGHRIKNQNCRLIKELKQYKNTHRLLLTGTPLQNNLRELWSLLNFLLPEIFDDMGSFETWFDVEVISDENADEAIIEEEKKMNILGMLHQILTPFMLRRVKADVDLEIPPKKEVLVYAPLSTVQREFYESTVDRTILHKLGAKYEKDLPPAVELDKKGRPKRGKGLSRADKNVEQNSEVNVRLHNIMMQLRKVCNHPYLLEYPLDPAGNYQMDEELVKKCGKMLILNKMLPELRRRGHKVLIFSQMTKMLDILEDYLCLRKYQYCRLDGSSSVESRQESMEEFNTDPETWIFLLSTRAGGLGVNLVAADTVIIYDSDWNPQCDLQAQDRCHRIGQTKPVMVYRFVTAKTIDQKIVERAAGKRKLEKMIIHKGKFKCGINNFSTEVKPLCPEELMELLKSKDHAGVLEEMKDGEVLSKDDLNALLDRSEIIREFEENCRIRKGQAHC